jgi:hypothetical protein
MPDAVVTARSFQSHFSDPGAAPGYSVISLIPVRVPLDIELGPAEIQEKTDQQARRFEIVEALICVHQCVSVALPLFSVNKPRRDPNTDRGDESTAASYRLWTGPGEGEMFDQTAPMIHTLTFATITDGQLLMIGAFLVTLMFITPLAWVIATTWAGVIKLRLRAGLKQQVIALKQEMIERGMTADEVVRVVGPPSEALDDLSEKEDDEAGDVCGPFAGEVVVEREGYEGQWHSALLLRRSGDRYLIHTCPGYEGCELPGNEWVNADRLRFPAPSRGQDGSPGDSADHTEAFDSGHWHRQPEKEPVPAEV